MAGPERFRLETPFHKTERFLMTVRQAQETIDDHLLRSYETPTHETSLVYPLHVGNTRIGVFQCPSYLRSPIHLPTRSYFFIAYSASAPDTISAGFIENIELLKPLEPSPPFYALIEGQEGSLGDFFSDNIPPLHLPYLQYFFISSPTIRDEDRAVQAVLESNAAARRAAGLPASRAGMNRIGNIFTLEDLYGKIADRLLSEI